MEPVRHIDARSLASELEFTASRGGGPGGQHVNKVSSRITVRFNIRTSQLLSPAEKELLEARLGTKLTRDGVLILSSDTHRSQLQNKQEVENRLSELLLMGLTEQKPRKATRPTKSSRTKRKLNKMLTSEKKRWRQKP